MIFRMDQLLSSLSLGLDAIERELVGCTTHHGKRVAVLTAAMAKSLGFNETQRTGLAACSILHDNALTESLADNQRQAQGGAVLLSHCDKGEANARHLPLAAGARGYIRYHHECADGSGPLGLPADKAPLGAQLIALADHLDVNYPMHGRTVSDLDVLKAHIGRERGVRYTQTAADALLAALDADLLHSLADERIDASYERVVPVWNVEVSADKMMDIAQMVAAVTDYKSAYTAKHSVQIANRAYWMARYYGLNEETCAKVYLAASLHDVGKLVTPIEILDKPGKLDAQEYAVIQKHVYYSYVMLKDVEGFGEICRWAVTHHRKLNGKGYPQLPDEYLEMDFVSRLMACIDVYQAVRETRPYHDSRTHAQTMAILWEMAHNGELDAGITQDLDSEMARFTGEGGDVPPPAAQDAPGKK